MAALAMWDQIDSIDVLHFLNYVRRAQETCVGSLAYSLFFSLYGFDIFTIAHMRITDEEI